MTFIESIYEKAKANKKTIAVPESTNEVMQKASAKIQADGIADIILVGDPAAINAKAEELGLDISSIRIVDSADEDYKNALLDKYEASPYKVMGRKFIEKRIGAPVYLATLMEAVGEVDATIAGIDTTTYEFVLAANSIIGMAPGCVTASGLQILELEEFQGEKDKFIGISDGAINVEPKTVDEPLTEDVDILFLGSAVYGAGISGEIKKFIANIDVNVGEVVNFSSAALIESTYNNSMKTCRRCFYNI